MCSLSEKELAEFHQYLEKDFPFDDPFKVKTGISHAGKQLEGVWVLSKHLHISEDGLEIPEELSKFAWQPIGGPGIEIPSKSSVVDLHCDIQLPLKSAEPLHNLLKVMKVLFKHNFIPGEYNCNIALKQTQPNNNELLTIFLHFGVPYFPLSIQVFFLWLLV